MTQEKSKTCMSNKSLYLVQSGFAATPAALAKLAQMYDAPDSVVLMGESVLQFQHPFIQQLNTFYILDRDAEILACQMIPNAKVISYDEFADLCLAYHRCIRLA